MKRFVLNNLRKWKEYKRRKPLIVKGARQVGKNWILEEFGKEFKDGYLHINFDKQEEYKQFFETTKDVRRILKNLAIASKKITTDTLIVRLSLRNLSLDGKVLNVLLFMADNVDKIIGIALQSLRINNL